MDEAKQRALLLHAAHRLFARGLASGSSGNISARLADGSALITPTRRSLGLLASDDFVRIDDAGNACDGGSPSSERPLHLAAYRARPDVRYVVHTHPTFCVVWANAGRMFARTTVAAVESLAPMVFVPYAAPGSRELAEAVMRAMPLGVTLGLLERHGLIAVGDDLEELFVQSDLAEECAKVAFYDEMMTRQ